VDQSFIAKRSRQNGRIDAQPDADFGVLREEEFRLNRRAGIGNQPCAVLARRKSSGDSRKAVRASWTIMLAHVGRTTNEVFVRRVVYGRLYHFGAERRR
jgi:hypothetical protein